VNNCANWIRVVLRTCCTLVFVLCLAAVARGQDTQSYTVDTFNEWLRKYANAKPDFKPGDVLSAKDLERIRPFVPPGYWEELNFPKLRMEIVTPTPHTPSQAYIDCSEKYKNQVRLADDGALANFTCGQPFTNDSLDVNDPQSGLKEAWNFEWKWQNYGLLIQNHVWGWVRNGGSHEDTALRDTSAPPPDLFVDIHFVDTLPTGINKHYGGGGTFERTLIGYYQKAYYSHLAQLKGGNLPIPNSSDFEFKEITAFIEPFDIRGTAFVVYRYLDPHRPDDAWAYIPTLRRVRRISAEVKSDSLLGTDLTIEDYYGFAGRELDWNWKFLGWKEVLNVYDPQDDYAHLYGANGLIADDVWSTRKTAVLLRTPKDPRHPYSAALMFNDPETHMCYLDIAFDRKGRLWKIIPWQWKYSETYKRWANINHGAKAVTWQHLSVIDVQNKRGTIVSCYGCGMPAFSAQELNRMYDIGQLEQSHR
jgi:hypothetical protein